MREADRSRWLHVRRAAERSLERIITTAHGRGFRFVAPLRRERVRAFASEAADFIDRNFELGRLEAALRRAQEDCGGLSYLTGEPGVGKTHLAHEFAARAVASGVACAHRVRCPEAFDAPAYGPWRQLARELANDRLASRFERLASGRPAQRVLAEAGRASAGGVAFPAELRPERVRLLLFESAALALAFLRFLSHFLPALPILIIATLWDADLVEERERSRLLAEAARSADAETLTLTAPTQRESGPLGEARPGRARAQLAR